MRCSGTAVRGGLFGLALIATPVAAGNRLIAAGQPVTVAKSILTVTPAREWNKLGARPGRHSETWTLDGEALNDLSFYAGVAPDETLFHEVSRRHKPLPRVKATMLVTDIPTLVENSYRVALDVALFTVDAMEPMAFAGKPGIRFTYRFTRPQEDLPRKGEGRAAMIDGKLYLMTFEAPRLHYFDAGVAAFRQVADSAKL